MSSDGAPLLSRAVRCAGPLLVVCAAMPLAAGASGSEPTPYGQYDTGLVRILRSEATTISKLREVAGEREVVSKHVEVKVRIENGLDRELRDLELDFAYRTSETMPLRNLRLRAALPIAPGETKELDLTGPLDVGEEAALFRVTVSGYTAHDPSGRTLLRMAASDGLVDQAAAAIALGLEDPRGLPAGSRPAVARVFAEAVARGPFDPEGRLDDSLVPLYVLRALGRLGTPADVPLLLGALQRGSRGYGGSLAHLAALGSEYPANPMMELLGEPDLQAIVTRSIRELAGEGAITALVNLAYGPELTLRSAAADVLRAGWPHVEQRAAGLRGAEAAPAREALCHTADAEGVRLLLALAAMGADEGRARTCITALPGRVAIPGTVAALPDRLGSAEPLAIELLSGWGEPARVALAEAATGLEVARDADIPTLARALVVAGHARRLAEFERDVAAAARETAPESLAGVGPEKREAALGRALGYLEDAEALAEEPGQRARLAVGHARLAHAALVAGQPRRVPDELARISSLLGGGSRDDTVEEALIGLAERIADDADVRLGAGWLDRIAELLDDGRDHPALARAFVSLAARSQEVALRERLALHALALDPSAVAAERLLARIREERRAPYVNALAVLAALGVVAAALATLGQRDHVRGACSVCRRVSMLSPAVFRYNIGMFLMRREARIEGELCKRCIHRHFWRYTLINLVGGWWGLISFCLTPVFTLGNVYHYLRALWLPARSAAPVEERAPRGTAPEARLAEPGLREKIADLLSSGHTHEEVADRLQREDGVPRGSTLALLRRLEEALAKQDRA